MDRATWTPVIASAIMYCAPMVCGAQFTTLHVGVAGSSLEATHFPSQSIGYAVGKDGSAYKSTDGGLNWEPLVTGSGAYLFGVSFLDVNTGFASGGGATVLKTVDGGANWTPLILPFTECIYQVQPITTSLVYAAGWGGYFFRSTDGGENWTISSIDPNWQGWVFGMHFLDELIGVVAQTDGRIYRTVDGGLNWTQSTTSTNNALRGISMGDATNGFAAGFFGTVQKSMDGGANWSTVNTGYPGDSYYGVHFTDAEHGVICGGFYSGGNWQGVIMRTENGGSSWSRIHTGGPVLNGITVREGSIFAVGVNEVIISDVLYTSIAQVADENDLRCHPNPATDRISIDPPFDDPRGPFTIDVFDTTGKCVLTGRASNGPFVIDVSTLDPGLYTIKASTAGQGATDSFVVVH